MPVRRQLHGRVREERLQVAEASGSGVEQGAVHERLGLRPQRIQRHSCNRSKTPILSLTRFGNNFLPWTKF